MNKNFYAKRINNILVIAPEKSLIGKINDAVLLIKKTDRKEYQKLKLKIKTIFITRRTGYGNEFFMPEKIWFSNISLIKKNDLNWLSSLIIHEAYHASQFRKGKYLLPLDKLEPLAHRAQEIFLKKLGENGQDAKIALNQKQWRKFDQDKTSSVYFRNLLTAFEDNSLKLTKA